MKVVAGFTEKISTVTIEYPFTVLLSDFSDKPYVEYGIVIEVPERKQIWPTEADFATIPQENLVLSEIRFQ